MKPPSDPLTVLDKFSPLVLGAVCGCGLMAGLFFVFSVAVMKALGALPPEKGMSAMQSINVAILNPVFMLVFMGTAALCAVTFVLALLHWQSPGARYLLAGSILYLAGGLLVTVVANVPMNDALAAAHPGTADAARVWANYLTNWTLWNHVRTMACLGATASYALALAA
jgi:uncharacterized membrane protein